MTESTPPKRTEAEAPPAPAPLTLNGQDLTIADLAAVARDGRPVALSPAAKVRMAAGRRVVEKFLSEGRPVYGLNTGLGARVGHSLTPEVMTEFSYLTIRGRSNALGEAAPREVVRAAMVWRLNSFLTGGAGANTALADALVAALNAGFHPRLPTIGSIGAGDLCVMAHLGLALIGEGQAEVGGELLPGAEALAKAGLAPLVLGPKDGLALANNSGFSAALAVLAFHDAEVLLESAEQAAALTMEGFRASLTPLDPRAQAARPAPGQAASAERLLALLAGGSLTEPGAARRLQDPISLRCVSQIHGAWRAALDFLRAHLEAEMTGATDNPLVLVEEEEIISNGNFHTTGLALALETLGQAIAHAAAASASRAVRLLTGRYSGLPDNLTRHGDNRSGFAPLYKVLEALVQEVRFYAQPAPQEQRWGADGTEDDVNATALSGKKLGYILERLRYLVAAEMIIAAQAVELREGITLGDGTKALHKAVRELVQPLEDDRPHGADVERLAEALSGLTEAGEPAPAEEADD